METININYLRLLAHNKKTEELERFYKPYQEKIETMFSKMNYIELTHQILYEKDIYLKDLECFLLGKKLLDYVGPITGEYLDFILPILSIESIWDLALSAKYEIIRKTARKKLDDIFDYYEIVYKEKEKQYERD